VSGGFFPAALPSFFCLVRSSTPQCAVFFFFVCTLRNDGPARGVSFLEASPFFFYRTQYVLWPFFPFQRLPLLGSSTDFPSFFCSHFQRPGHFPSLLDLVSFRPAPFKTDSHPPPLFWQRTELFPPSGQQVSSVSPGCLLTSFPRLLDRFFGRGVTPGKGRTPDLLPEPRCTRTAMADPSKSIP